MMRFACTLALAFLLASDDGVLHAQADPRLVAAVRQAQEGAGDSARASLRRILDATNATDPFYPQVLYAWALVAPTAADMQRTLQRITVEHPLSMWTDDALLKLAQLEYAGGNLPGTVRNLERLRGDFPASPMLGLAAFWAARSYFDMREQRPACQWVGAGIAALRPDEVEVRSQLNVFAQRCPAALLAQGSAGVAPASARVETTAVRDTTPAAPPVAAAPPDSPADSVPAAAPTPRDTVTPAPRAADSAAGPVFRVQVVAAAERSMADDAVRRVRALGVPARIVTEGAFLKVRAGEFTDRTQAAELLGRLRGEFPGAFIVSEP